MAFDVITPVRLGVQAIPTITGTVYTVPASTRTILKSIDIANTNGAGVTVSVYLVPSGDSASNANTLLPGVTIAANTLLQWAGVQVLEAGDTLQAVGSTTGISIIASGGEAV